MRTEEATELAAQPARLPLRRAQAAERSEAMANVDLDELARGDLPKMGLQPWRPHASSWFGRRIE
jgi:hypothetical protein